MANKTKVYGIKFMVEKEVTEKVNDLLNYIYGKDSPYAYVPFKFTKNIYFTKAVEARKVSEYYNQKNKGLIYHVYPTSLESLERVKRSFENDKSLKKKSPSMYHKLTGYRIYNSAEEYFDTINESETLALIDEKEC